MARDSVVLQPSAGSGVFQNLLESLPQYAMQMQKMRQSQAVQERQLLMQEQKHNWTMKVAEKEENASNALNKWSEGNYNWGILGEEDARDAYSMSLSSEASAIDGYKTDMDSYGMNASVNTLLDAKQVVDKKWVDAVTNRFESDAKIFRQSGQNTLLSDDKLNRHLQDNYNAQNVFNNYASIYGTDAAVARFAAFYTPTADETGTMDYLKSIFSSPDISDPMGGGVIPGTGGVNAGGIAQTAGGVGILGGMTKGYTGHKKRTADALTDIAKDWKKGGMSAKNFLAKYGMTKTQAGGNPLLKGANFASSDDILNFARAGSVGKLTNIGKKALPYAAGASVGQAIVGEDASAPAQIAAALGGGAVGQLTYSQVLKALAKPETAKKVMKLLGPKMAAKLGISTAGIVAPEGISTLLGGAGLAWTAHDIYSMLKGD